MCWLPKIIKTFVLGYSQQEKYLFKFTCPYLHKCIILFKLFTPQADLSKKEDQNHRVRGWTCMEIHRCTLRNQINHVQGTQNDTMYFLWLVLISIQNPHSFPTFQSYEGTSKVISFLSECRNYCEGLLLHKRCHKIPSPITLPPPPAALAVLGDQQPVGFNLQLQILTVHNLSFPS